MKCRANEKGAAILVAPVALSLIATLTLVSHLLIRALG